MSDDKIVPFRPMREIPPSNRSERDLQALLLSNELDGRADAIEHRDDMKNLRDCLRRASKMMRRLLGVEP